MKPTHLLASAVTVLVLAATGCSSPGAADAGDSAGEGGDDRLAVLASFYPLQYVAERIGGDSVEVRSLTPPATEPHDVEVSPRVARDLATADVVVVLSGGFQPAVDEAVAARRPATVVDAATVPSIAAAFAERRAAPGAEALGPDEPSVLGGDPHFWLDPSLVADLAQTVAETFAEVDPARAEEYAARAADLTADLAQVRQAYAEGLAACDRDVVVVSHEAFGFLLDGFGIQQVGLSGLDPEAEPSPARLREIRSVVREQGVTTIFTESLVSPKVAESLAAELGVTTALLDPVESQLDESTDYRGVMLANLEVLRTALGCS